MGVLALPGLRVATALAIRFRIKANAAVAQPQVTLGHGFARGDVPAGSRLTLTTAAGVAIPVQQDGENAWSDGSLRHGVISFVAPESYAAGDINTYILGCEAGAPNRANPVTPAQLAAASDFKLHVSQQDYGADAFTVGVNDVLASLPPWNATTGWGTNPLGGWEMVRSGPICTEWRVWRFLKRDSDGASHRWVKAVIYVRAWGPSGPFEVLPGLRQSNCYGAHPSGTVGASGAQPNHVGVAELYNGTTRIAAYGGVNDPRYTSAVPATAFDPTNNVWNGTAPGAWNDTYAVCYTLSGSGVPSGIPQNTIVWNTSSWGSSGWASNRANAGYNIQGGFSSWVAGGGAGGAFIYRINGALWYANNSGTFATTGSGPVPSNVPGHTVTDGNVSLTQLTYAVGTQGTGTATLTPYVGTFPGAGWWGALPDGSIPWVGAGARPAIMPAHDMAYLTRETRLIPPYDLSLVVPPDPAGQGGTFQPNQPMYGNDLSVTGDGPGDERIGYLNYSQIHLLLGPFDPEREKTVRRFGFGWHDYTTWWEDERHGRFVNTGTTTYGPVTANSLFLLLNNPNFYGTPPWQGLNLGGAPNYYTYRYAGVVDTSHMPSPWIVPYLRTGHAAFIETGLANATGLLGTISGTTRNFSQGATNYENIAISAYNIGDNVRGGGWALRALGMVDCLLPEADPMRPFIKNVLDQNAAYAGAVASWADPAFAKVGAVFSYSGNAVYVEPFMYALFCYGAAMEAWRGERAGWMPLLQVLSNYSMAPYDEAQGGSGYWVDLYRLNPCDGGGTPWPSTTAMMAGYGPYRATSTQQYDSGDHGYFQGAAGYPACQGDTVLQRAALIMMATAGVPRAAFVQKAIDNRLNTPPLAMITWSGVEGTVATAYPTWDIVVP